MDLLASDASRLRFEAYVKEVASVIGHADRVVPLHDYCTGLLLPGERKSVEPIAALTAPARTAPKHQSLLHFVANAPWSDQAVLTKIRQTVLPQIEALGAIEASIVDDTGFPKKGKHSVGVARQQQAPAIITQRLHPIRMPDHLSERLDIGPEPFLLVLAHAPFPQRQPF